MTTKMRFHIVCILTLAAILGAACSKKLDLKEEIVGKWEGEFQGAVTQMEFTAEGKLIISGSAGDETISSEGIYTFTDDDKITITLLELGLEEVPGEIEIEGDKLTIHDPLGEIAGDFTRLK